MTTLVTTELAPRLVAASDARRRASLPELYDRFGPTAYSLALSVTTDARVAEQIVAAAFDGVWHDFDSRLGSTSTFFADLMTAVRAGAVAHRSPETQVATFAAAPPTGDSLQAAVGAALRELRGSQQQILALAYFGGLRVGDIASHLEMPLASVKLELQAALQHVRTKLGHEPQTTVTA